MLMVAENRFSNFRLGNSYRQDFELLSNCLTEIFREFQYSLHRMVLEEYRCSLDQVFAITFECLQTEIEKFIIPT